MVLDSWMEIRRQKYFVRRDKLVLFKIDLPGNWFAPLSSNRSGDGGNKIVGAFDVKGRLSGSVSMQVAM